MSRVKKILLIQGPNLNRLGKRSKEHYGHLTLEELNEKVMNYSQKLSVELTCCQSNSEGEMINWLHDADEMYDGVLMNAGAYTHYSYALRDAIESIDIPVVEVHLSKVEEREAFRQVSVIRDVCVGKFSGEKEISYFKAMDFLNRLLCSR